MTSWTPAHLTKLESAIAKGVLSVQYEDRKVQYRTLSEMLQLRDLLKTELGGATKGPPRRRLARHDKGLH